MRIVVVDPKRDGKGAYVQVLDDLTVLDSVVIDRLTSAGSIADKWDVPRNQVLIECSHRRLGAYHAAEIVGATVVRRVRSLSTGDVRIDTGQPVQLIRIKARRGKGPLQYGAWQDCHDAGVEYLRYRRGLDDAGVVPAPLVLTVEEKARKYDLIIARLSMLEKHGGKIVSQTAEALLRDVK